MNDSSLNTRLGPRAEAFSSGARSFLRTKFAGVPADSGPDRRDDSLGHGLERFSTLRGLTHRADRSDATGPGRGQQA